MEAPGRNCAYAGEGRRRRRVQVGETHRQEEPDRRESLISGWRDAIRRSHIVHSFKSDPLIFIRITESRGRRRGLSRR